jgi:hypothetical protein
MDRPKVHKSSATSLDPEPDEKNNNTIRPRPSRAIIATYFTEVEHVARFLQALRP